MRRRILFSFIALVLHGIRNVTLFLLGHQHLIVIVEAKLPMSIPLQPGRSIYVCFNTQPDEFSLFFERSARPILLNIDYCPKTMHIYIQWLKSSMKRMTGGLYTLKNSFVTAMFALRFVQDFSSLCLTSSTALLVIKQTS